MERPPLGGSPAPLPWIVVERGRPYFKDENGRAWTPIGANEAITWPDLAPLFRRKDPAAAEAYLRGLKDSGVTCLRLMLEYCQGEHRYLERPVGRFAPNMVRLWDDLFELLEKVGLRVLLTPYDTFFMWTRWRHHPYNKRNGGVCSSRRRWLTCPRMREAVKGRLAFASDRWGHSGALFAWDIWNEIHPAHGGDDAATIAPFVSDISRFLRTREIARFGRAHPQTVSIFGPQLAECPATVEPIFRHPELDFASTHLYEFGTIDHPRDTVAPALAVGRLMREAVAHAGDLRPVLDSEHGPIHLFKDRRVTLPEAFDDEYFRHIQWAHLASGGAGGGMRWPNRHPHSLTPGMRRAQAALARFLPLIDWTAFRRSDFVPQIACSDPGVEVFACGDANQAVVWLLARGPLGPDGRLAAGAPRQVTLQVRGLEGEGVTAVPFDTASGQAGPPVGAVRTNDALEITVSLTGDVALAISAQR